MTMTFPPDIEVCRRNSLSRLSSVRRRRSSVAIPRSMQMNSSSSSKVTPEENASTNLVLSEDSSMILRSSVVLPMPASPTSRSMPLRASIPWVSETKASWMASLL